VSAVYTSGDGAYTNASSPPVTYTDQATPTVAVTPSGTGPSGSVTFTTTVTGSGSVAPAGTVDFDIGGAACDAVPVIPDTTANVDAGIPACVVAVVPGQAVTAGYTSANAVYTDANSTPVTFTSQGTPMVSISGRLGRRECGGLHRHGHRQRRGRPIGSVIISASPGGTSCTIAALGWDPVPMRPSRSPPTRATVPTWPPEPGRRLCCLSGLIRGSHPVSARQPDGLRVGRHDFWVT
jgi:hypothetical protein